MDTLIQVAAACGPVALAIMRVVVSLNPPDRMGRAHKVWASSFALVGVLAAFAIFFELRGTDQILGQIWEHVRDARDISRPESRHLDADQKVRMRKALKLGPDENYEFQINSMPSCEECELFAQELREFFNTIAGWKTEGGPLIFSAPPLRGLEIICRDEEKNSHIIKKIDRSFSEAGMPLKRATEDVKPGMFIVLVGRSGS